MVATAAPVNSQPSNGEFRDFDFDSALRYVHFRSGLMIVTSATELGVSVPRPTNLNIFAGFVELVVGLVLPVWLLRSWQEWRIAYTVMSTLGILGLVALGYGLRAIQLLAGSGHL